MKIKRIMKKIGKSSEFNKLKLSQDQNNSIYCLQKLILQN
jgi:hypothetical protein